ncbi:MAG: WecB/TagA/CpsF family glycosyltransferase [Chloroflexi bacterium]|nr:WecB/TagA/CpsF family glycosyltransferase [Chloroflexota bacterium]
MPEYPNQRINVLGVWIDSLGLAELLERVSALARDGEQHTVMYANVHVLNTVVEDALLRRTLNNADLVYCDGDGVRLGARLLGQHLPQRMTGADWIYPACEHWQQEGLSVFFFGGAPGVADRAVAKLKRQYPALRIAGTHAGFFTDSSAVVAAVNVARPDILLAGMGTPIQERWVAEHATHLEVSVIWTVGAVMDFVSGEAPRAPRWMLGYGLEWLGRLLAEPRRLWRRYLIGNPLFLWRVLQQRLGLLRFED